MSNFFREILKRRSARVLVLIFFSFLIIIGYFISNSYSTQFRIHKENVLTRLEAIVKTAVTQLDGSHLEYLFLQYDKRGDTLILRDDKVYQLVYEQLQEIKNHNELSGSIYTLSYDSLGDKFLYGISLFNTMKFRQPFEDSTNKIKELYYKGGKLGVCIENEKECLSVIAPLKNSKGEVIGVLKINESYHRFLQEVHEKIAYNIIYSFLISLFLFILLIRVLRHILNKEDLLTDSLRKTKMSLELKNKDLLDSLHYAKLIQQSMQPNMEKVIKYLPDIFIYDRPRDIVSGDFFWSKEMPNKFFIACADCTGHGVPGAIISMLGNVLLNDIIERLNVQDPAKILKLLHKRIVKILKQDQYGSNSHDGMDIAFCMIDKVLPVLYFSGALRPLIIIRNEQVIKLDPDPNSIGGIKRGEKKFTCRKIIYQPGDVFYIFSDGYADQFGGDRDKKYMSKRFLEYLKGISHLNFDQQKKQLHEEFESWKGEREQTDDVMVIGFKLPINP